MSNRFKKLILKNIFWMCSKFFFLPVNDVNEQIVFFSYDGELKTHIDRTNTVQPICNLTQQ